MKFDAWPVEPTQVAHRALVGEHDVAPAEPHELIGRLIPTMPAPMMTALALVGMLFMEPIPAVRGLLSDGRPSPRARGRS